MEVKIYKEGDKEGVIIYGDESVEIYINGNLLVKLYYKEDSKTKLLTKRI